eukprot:6957585-Karenia_brevis.AAC.1
MRGLENTPGLSRAYLAELGFVLPSSSAGKGKAPAEASIQQELAQAALSGVKVKDEPGRVPPPV